MQHPDRYFNSAAARVAAQAGVTAGETAGERNTGNVYLRTDSGWLQVGTAGAAHVTLTDPATGLSLGILNGGVKVSDVYAPARDVFQSWFFGSDGALETLTVNVANNGLWLDMSLINPSMRQLVIVNGNATQDYAYTIQFSRNGLGSTTDDTFNASVVGAGAKTQIVAVPLTAALGYEKYIRLVITPTVGQAGAQLTFKAYLTGRGG